ncbi:MAG TPA: response regulator [Nitrospirota bacterium]|nr:response regulator [Nitrospirota bacterium]
MDILIVDDEKTFLELLSEGLSSYSKYFNVITADNGKMAIEVLKTFIIDVVVTDLKMPEADGYEIVKYMKQYRPDVPIIIMTAHGDPETEKRLRNMGITQYLEKPLELRGIVREIMSAGERSPRAPGRFTAAGG